MRRRRRAERLRRALPAALVPLLAPSTDLPTRTSGKVDRNALPWPLPLGRRDLPSDELSGTAAWLAEQWSEILGSPVDPADDDFFAIGGGSLAAAQLVSLIRERFPAIAVSDLYTLPTLGGLARKLDELAVAETEQRVIAPTPKAAGLVQSLVMVLLYTLVGLRWLVALATANDLLGRTGVFPWAPTVPWWAVAAGWVLLISPFGRMGLSALGARLLLRGSSPAVTSAVPVCTCDCGRRSGWPTWPASATCPARRGSPTTRGRSAPRSAPTSTCTRCRR